MTLPEAEERRCVWCGSLFKQARTGRTREYCRRSCRQRAYEDRLARDRAAVAVERALVRARQESSRDVPPPRPELTRDESESTRDEMQAMPESTRDETRQPVVLDQEKFLKRHGRLPGSRSDWPTF